VSAPEEREQNWYPVSQVGWFTAHIREGIAVAGHLRRQGADVAELEVALLAINARRCVPPLPEREVEKIARSIGGRLPGASIDTSKPAMRRRVKTGQRGRGVETGLVTTASASPTASRAGWGPERGGENPHAAVRRVSRPAAGAWL